MLGEHLKKIIKDEAGVEVSEEQAVKVFQSFIYGVAEHAFHSDGYLVEVEKVGRFGIIRRNVGGGKEAGWPFIPRLVYYPSVLMDVYMDTLFSVGGHENEEVEHYGIYKEVEE